MQTGTKLKPWSFLTIFLLATSSFLGIMPYAGTILPMRFVASSSPPIGSCLPNGQLNITTAIYWANLNCVHIGNLNITGTGSLTLINSSLLIGANGSSSNMTVGYYGELSLVNSILNLNGSQLFVVGNSSMIMSNSSLLNGALTLNNNANFIANQGSLLEPTRSISQALVNIEISNSELITNNSAFLHGNSLTATSSKFFFNNAPRVALAGQTSSITSCQFSVNNVTSFQIGNALSQNSSTTLSSSSISDNGYLNSTLILTGTYYLNIANTSISNLVGTFQNGGSFVTLQGGNVSLSNSSITSSALGYIGYSSASTSSFNVSSTTAIITNTKIFTGQLTKPGVFRFSNDLFYASNGNFTIANSYLGLTAQSTNLTFDAFAPATTQFIVLKNTFINTEQSPGTVSFQSSYGIALYQSRIDANNSAFSMRTYSLTAVNSNVTTNLVFGNGVQTGALYNTTSYAVKTVPGGSLSQYGWLLVHLISKNKGLPVANATINVIDTIAGSLDYTSTTNSSGWAKIAAILTEVNSSSSMQRSTYIVSAYNGTLRSPQALVASNNTFYANLVLGGIGNFTGFNIQNLSSYNIANIYNIANLSYAVYPQRYSFGQYVPYISILSNAVPLGYYNNFSNSEIDFQTAGTPGYTFYFTVIYPKNLTTVPFTIRSDGVVISSSLRSNATHYFASFSVGSGDHKFSMSYIPVNGFYNTQQYPFFFPGSSTVLAVVLLAIIGSAFLAFYVLRSERTRKKMDEPVSPKPEEKPTP
ncbi:MAG: hypothetical protein ACYC7D_13845 [Nitrososphaerales archaeon]